MAEEERFRVPLDAEMIQVLASDTRRELLRILTERRMTLSELAREVDLKKPTVHEHLAQLTGAGLVARDEDEDRLWVYYELTHRGQEILSPDRTRLYLALGGIAAAAVVAVAALVLAQTFLAPASPAAPDVAFDVGGERAADEAADAADPVAGGSGVTVGPGTNEATWWQGLDGPLTVRLGETAEGGTLALHPVDGSAAALSVPVETDRARIQPESLDDLPEGPYELRYRSEGVSTWTTLSANLTLGSATVHVVAPGLVAGTPGTVRVASTPPEAIDRAALRLSGGAEGTETSAEHGRKIRVEAAAPGTVELRVARQTVHPIPVAPHLATNVTATSESLVLEVVDGEGQPAADVAVRVDGRSEGFTDHEGRLAIDRPAPGVHELALTTPDGHRTAWPIAVDDDRVERAPAPTPRIVPTRLGPTGATVEVAVGPADGAPRNVTIVADDDGETVRAVRRTLPAGADASVPVTFEALPADVAARVLPQATPPLSVDGRVQPGRAANVSADLTNPVAVTDLAAEPLAGGEIRVSVTVDNPTGTPAGRHVAVLVDGDRRTRLTVDLGPGEEITRDVLLAVGPGDHRVVVDDLEVQVLDVEAGERVQPTVPAPGLVWVLVAGLAAWCWRRW